MICFAVALQRIVLRWQPDPTQLPRSFVIFNGNDIDFPVIPPLTVNERWRSIRMFESINTCDTERTPARL